MLPRMPKSYSGKSWDELVVGQEFWTGGRTVTEGDVLAFAGLTGDYNPLHVDEEFARTSPFKTRVPHGPLIHDMYLGLMDRDRKRPRLNSSHGSISYAVFCLQKKK